MVHYSITNFEMVGLTLISFITYWEEYYIMHIEGPPCVN